VLDAAHGLSNIPSDVQNRTIFTVKFQLFKNEGGLSVKQSASTVPLVFGELLEFNLRKTIHSVRGFLFIYRAPEKARPLHLCIAR
jgi:hypothetical protein